MTDQSPKSKKTPEEPPKSQKIRAEISNLKSTCRALLRSLESTRRNYYDLVNHHKRLKEKVEDLERELVIEEKRIQVVHAKELKKFQKKQVIPEDMTQDQLERMIEKLQEQLEKRS